MKSRSNNNAQKQDFTLEFDNSTNQTTKEGHMRCKFCNRSFAMARILTHQNICRKVKHKPNSVAKNVNMRNEKDD